MMVIDAEIDTGVVYAIIPPPAEYCSVPESGAQHIVTIRGLEYVPGGGENDGHEGVGGGRTG